jgi:tetratricopeptide (TPR) repeat protein
MLARIIAITLLCLATSRFALSDLDAEATILSIQDLISSGGLGQAASTIEKGLKKYPRSGGIYNLRGIVSAQQGHTSEAEADFLKALSLEPQLLSAYLNLGRLYQSSIDADPSALSKAIDIYQRALTVDPRSDEAHYQLAVMLEWRGAFAESLKNLATLPESKQKEARVLALRCADLTALERSVEAAQAARELAASRDFRDEDFQAILPVLDQRRKFELIRTLIEALQQRHLASTASERELAKAYENLGELGRARSLLESLAQQEGPSVQLLMDLARVAYKQQDREGALGYLAHARDIDPGNAMIHFAFGTIALELRLPLEAESSIKKALELQPDNPDFNYGMAVVELHGHDASKAIPYFQKFLSMKKDDVRGRYGLAIADFLSGNYEQSKEIFLTAINTPETCSGAHYFLGRIAKLDADSVTAETEFRQAIEHDPKNVEAHAELASLLIRSKRYADAKRTLDEALAIDADNFVANTNLLVLYQRTKDDRAAAQSEKLEALGKKRDEMQELLYRRIEVRPY